MPANATLHEVEDLTASVRRLQVRPDDGVPPFSPGQYFALGVEAGGRLVQRPYSTASAADEREALEFLVRRVPEGMLTPRLWQLSVGARLHVGRPKGLFGLVADDPRTHLFVATGTGIAPFVSMLAALSARRDPPRVVVVHGVAHPTELTYADVLRRRARDGYLPAVSRPEAAQRCGWTGLVGRVGAVILDRWSSLGLDPRETVAYLCGNPGMVADVRALLEAQGLPAAAIHAEEYWVAPSA